VSVKWIRVNNGNLPWRRCGTCPLRLQVDLLIRAHSGLGFPVRMDDHGGMNSLGPQIESSEAAMRRAINLASAGVLDGLGGPFGAVIVKAGRVLSEGENRVTSSGDPTAHAEIVAIRAACEVLGTHVLEGCEIYSSCEPCPMCLSAISWARIDRLYYGASRREAANAGFDDERLYLEIAKAPSERKLSCVCLLPQEALESFKVWNDKSNRTPY
jgi:guanine deaminase